MIDIEIYGTGGRTTQSRVSLLAQTRRALASASYGNQLTLVDTESAVYSMDQVQMMPFARVYAPPSVLPNIIDDIRDRLKDLFETLEGIQVIRVNTRGNENASHD
jgi:hypothetical protein